MNAPPMANEARDGLKGETLPRSERPARWPGRRVLHRGKSTPISGDDFVNNLPKHIRQSEITSMVRVGQFFVIHSKQM